MALAYRPPGVYVDELSSPSVSPLLATAASVGIVGAAQGYVQRTDTIALTGTTAHSLVTEGNLPSDATLIKVVSITDTVDPGNAPNSDGSYRGPAGGTTGTGVDYDVSTTAKTVSREGTGVIPAGRVVNVTYQYVPSDYWTPTRFDDLGSIQTKYGPAWSNGAIFSDLTYAAALAFENGASFVICQPLFARATPGDPTTAQSAPNMTASNATAGAYANPSTWSDTLYVLRDIEDINVFVPVVGQNVSRQIKNADWLAIVQKFQDHVKFLKDQEQYSIVLAGEDGTTTSVVSGEFPTKTSIRNDASTLAARYGGDLAEDTVLVNTSKFTRQRPDSTQATLTVGGQFMAAALAGMLAARNVSASLTRKQVSGFISATDYRSKQDKNDDAAGGLLVIEQKGVAIIVRHAVTTDTTAVQKRELNVVRAKHRLVESLRDTIDSQVIGRIVADANAPHYIATIVISVLERLKVDKDIVEYANVDVRQLSLEPTTIEVRFSYLPAFTINYVNLVFGIDLTTGDVNINIAGTQ